MLTRGLRLCLWLTTEMSFDELSELYGRIFLEKAGRNILNKVNLEPIFLSVLRN